MPEFPLKLRLIGLRVTKLKDLHVDADNHKGSLKRVRDHSPGTKSTFANFVVVF